MTQNVRAGLRKDLIVNLRCLSAESAGESGKIVRIAGIFISLHVDGLALNRDGPAQLLGVEEEQSAGADQHVIAVPATCIDVVNGVPAFGKTGRDHTSR